jgi:Leucine-rich repeat (LRR) protein
MKVVLLVSLILSIFSFSMAQKCPFEGCLCYFSDFIYCDGASNSSLPNRIFNTSYNYVSILVLQNYIPSSDELPKDYLSNLIIETLIIQNIGLKEINNKTFKGVNGLKELIITQNSIKKISSDAFKQIGQTTTKLDLSGNNITSNLFASLTPSFSYLRQLKELNLTNNNIQSLAADAFAYLNSSLVKLYLDKNGIDDDGFIQIEASVSTLGNLESISLINNKLTYLNGTLFRNLQNLNSINLTSNQIENIESSTFANNLNLDEIDLRNNQISNSSMLKAALKPTLAKLSTLNMNNNPIDYDADFFSGFNKLFTLSLDRNQINEVKNNQFNGIKSLYDLILSNNNISQISDSDTFPYRLITLEMSNNSLDMIPNLSKLNQLQEFGFANQNGKLNTIKDYAFEVEGQSFRNLKISLRKNNITNFGSKAFCSRYSKQNEISKIEIDSSSFKYLNKCIIKQLRLFNGPFSETLIEVAPVDPLTDAAACNCSLINFLRLYRIVLGGVCSGIKCPNEPIKDDCILANEFSCENPFATTTTTTTTTITTRLTTTTISKQSSFSLKTLANSILIINCLIFIIALNNF